MKPIEESGMKFGIYEENELFHIEKSAILADLGQGIKTVEFILKREENQIWFVEAKKSVPNADNRENTEKQNRKFEEFYNDVRDKFCDSLQVFLATVLNRYEDIAEVGSSLRETDDFEKCKLYFVLVIKSAKIEWLAAPKAILEKRLFALKKNMEYNYCCIE